MEMETRSPRTDKGHLTTLRSEGPVNRLVRSREKRVREQRVVDQVIGADLRFVPMILVQRDRAVRPLSACDGRGAMVATRASAATPAVKASNLRATPSLVLCAWLVGVADPTAAWAGWSLPAHAAVGSVG
jgi:hypothetical protein